MGYGPEVFPLDWPVRGSFDQNMAAVWAEIQMTSIGQLVSSYGGASLQIAFGVLDVIGGAAMTLGTCGGAVVPGLGLMIVGVDQIIAGAYNISNPGTQSAFEYLGAGVALGLGASNGAAQVIGALTPAVLSMAFGAWGSLAGACFAARTPLLTLEGSEYIENIKEGDYVLTRDEFDPDGPVVARPVEEVFRNYAPIWHVHVGGQVIRTTGEHPFWVRGKGWTAGRELRVGDELSSHDGRWMAVEDLLDTGEWEAVYNLRVGDHHTYFVGSAEWTFSVWSHNACFVLGETMGRVNELAAQSAVARFGDILVAMPKAIPWPIRNNMKWLWGKLRNGHEFLDAGLDTGVAVHQVRHV